MALPQPETFLLLLLSRDRYALANTQLSSTLTSPDQSVLNFAEVELVSLDEFIFLTASRYCKYVSSRTEDLGSCAYLNNEVENQNDDQRDTDNHRPNPIIKVLSASCHN